MALTAVRPAMNHYEEKSVHPFFSKTQRTNAPEPLPSADESNDSDYKLTPSDAVQPENARRKRPRKSQSRVEKKANPTAKNQASIDSFARPPRTGGNEISSALDQDPIQGRRKRRKTESPAPESHGANIPQPALETSDWLTQLQTEAERRHPTGDVRTEKTQDSPGTLTRPTTPRDDFEPEHLATAVQEPNEAQGNPHTITPKKQIRVTKTGKLVSSPPKASLQETGSPKKRRGRKPAKAKTSSTITIIKYGLDPASRMSIGTKIEAIIKSLRSNTNRPPAPTSVAPKPGGPPKITHPFFLGKSNQKAEPPTNPAGDQRPPTPRKSAVNPGKLLAEARRDYESAPMPSFGMSSSASRIPKQSGLSEAPWPTRETSHVRNLDEELYHGGQRNGEVDNVTLRPRKSKNRPVTLKDEEEIICRLGRDLAKKLQLNNNQVCTEPTPPDDVRLPSRLLTTGKEIQERVRQNVHTRLGPSSGLCKGHEVPHPAITKLYNEIANTFTPFDEGRCEAQAWVQKYSPNSASTVLQNGPEAFVLRDWLQSLTVMAVGGAQGSIKPETSDSKKPLRKKRKKAVDNFIVSDNDDEEGDEMIPCSDNNSMLPLEMQSFQKPTWTRNNNVILISGPHGCGKSATVYAVARELGFEIFEINSGTRRSGKDIIDKVGDMTANHLVNHQRNDAPPKQELPAEDTDDERNNTALQNDLDSGRQGTMMSFFKAKPAMKPKSKLKIKSQEKKVIPISAAQKTLPIVQASKKSQKQSLILFEEADILFEEDQQFWAQVTRLALQSKRPIVITCNDERQIPMNELPLAAILRLQPIPVDLASDYLLVLAGREGHILARDAVTELYKSKHQDLRASITELSLWCQMSVGDRKGGLEWMYQRWPPGKDVDAHGNSLRVASEDTYQSGMGLLSHSIFKADSNPAFDKEERLLNDIWLDWGINPLDWNASLTTMSNTPDRRTQTLGDLYTYTDALSAADVYCRVGLPSCDHDFEQLTDSSLPQITDKTRLSYTLAAPVLEVDHHSDFSGFDTAVYVQAIILAKRVCNPISGMLPSEKPHPVTEADHVKAILHIRGEKEKERVLSRLDFARALDVLADPPEQVLSERSSFHLVSSSFDRNFSIITRDLAPYIRSIVAHEKMLEEQRIRLSNLLSEGGKGKRARTTRASRVALEGGVRETKRRDRWFDANVNFELVMATAGKDWSGMGWKTEATETEAATGSAMGTPQDSLAGNEDIIMENVDDE